MSTANFETTNQLVETTNLSRFTEIFHLCFGYRVDEKYFTWKYLENPAGNLIAFETVNNENGEVGAFYGIIPEEYVINGEKKTIYQSMDTMTHPNYRNRGLFIKLANLTYDHAFKEFGSLKLIGIPGSNSYHGFVNKLHWKNPHNFSYIFQHSLLIKALGLFTKYSVELEQIGLFDEETDVFFASKKYYKSAYKVFNKEVLNWKISKHPFHKFISYKVKKGNAIIGLVILLKEDNNNLKIVYADFLDNEHRSYLKETIKAIASKISFKYIYTWEPTDDVLLQQYKKSMFLKNPYKRGIFSYKVPLILLTRDGDTEFWENPDNLELQPIIQD
jgi:hypothetical protein